jgi:hypothetical protein
MNRVRASDLNRSISHERVDIYGENYWQKQAESLMNEKKHHLKENYELRI